MNYGPTRGEWKIRLAISVFGLAFVAAAIALRGWPEGPGLVEVVGVGVLFFGITAVRAVLALWRG